MSGRVGASSRLDLALGQHEDEIALQQLQSTRPLARAHGPVLGPAAQ
jgi:hypothetical protein